MLKPSAKVGVCPVCEQNAPLKPAPSRRWEMPTVVAEHTAPGVRWCSGRGQRSLPRSRAWGWPEWDRMCKADRQAALVHMMWCSNPVTAGSRPDHPVLRFEGRVLRGLPSALACVHAWEQTGGWEVALGRWGVDQVRSWIKSRVLVKTDQVLEHYGWQGYHPFVEEDRMVGVLADAGAVRPQGWLWKHTPPGVVVAVPDRRTAVGRAISRHLMVVEAVPRARVKRRESDEYLGGVVRQAARLRRVVDVQAPSGAWTTLIPSWEKAPV